MKNPSEHRKCGASRLVPLSTDSNKNGQSLPQPATPIRSVQQSIEKTSTFKYKKSDLAADALIHERLFLLFRNKSLLSNDGHKGARSNLVQRRSEKVICDVRQSSYEDIVSGRR